MSATYNSEWADLWRKWNHHERIWAERGQGALVWALVEGAPAKREETLKQWASNSHLHQPTSKDVENLSALGDRLLRLNSMQDPLPDVYAAACAMKTSTVTQQSKANRQFAFRGTRNDTWPLIPSVQRPDDSGPVSEEVLGVRYHQLALFCEVMRQLLQSQSRPADELTCMAIAQHYGLKTPLVDLTWSPWVALFFASHNGVAGDVGIVQCFSVSALRELLTEDDYGLGQFRVADHLDFVPRIRTQQGLFVELPTLGLDTHLVPYSRRFAQINNVVFEDSYLGISESLIYPPKEDDSLARLVNPKLKSYPNFKPAEPPSPELFYQHLLKSCTDFIPEHDAMYEQSMRWLAEFHYKLQGMPSLRPFERSITRLRTAYGKLVHAARAGSGIPQCRDYVESYLSLAGEEAQKEILAVWETMRLDVGAHST